MALYADIIEIVAPSQAAPGDPVSITIRVKNLYSAPIGIMVGGALEYGVSPWPGIPSPQTAPMLTAEPPTPSTATSTCRIEP